MKKLTHILYIAIIILFAALLLMQQCQSPEVITETVTEVVTDTVLQEKITEVKVPVYVKGETVFVTKTDTVIQMQFDTIEKIVYKDRTIAIPNDIVQLRTYEGQRNEIGYKVQTLGYLEDLQFTYKAKDKKESHAQGNVPMMGVAYGLRSGWGVTLNLPLRNSTIGYMYNGDHIVSFMRPIKKPQ